jgi:hypothetical protein
MPFEEACTGVLSFLCRKEIREDLGTRNLDRGLPWVITLQRLDDAVPTVKLSALLHFYNAPSYHLSAAILLRNQGGIFWDDLDPSSIS